MEINSEETLAHVARSRPAAVRVFESFGLDYCCKGRRSVARACEQSGIDLTAVMDALRATDPGPDLDWGHMGVVELVDAIEATHHAYLHTELVRLSVLAEKVSAKHATDHPELVDVRRTFEELCSDLSPHLEKEERVLFPMIRMMAAETGGATAFGASLDAPISVMMLEHDQAGELLSRLRMLTAGYETPANGCASYRALYDGLAELECDTHLHIHRENNVLFPAVVGLESLASTRE
ncbi:MAG: iron-sulfur cluster repair di-iron protein [Acidimicrobiales bacterium]